MFQLRGNLDFPGFLKKMFYNINYCTLYLDPQFSFGRLTLWPLQQVVFQLPYLHTIIRVRGRILLTALLYDLGFIFGGQTTDHFLISPLMISTHIVVVDRGR